jgi:hypothetical protein
MFHRRKIDIRMINPTSKMSLKMSCLQAAHGNVEQAQKIFSYFADGLQSLPDFEPPRASILQQAKSFLDGLFETIDSNEQRINKVVSYYQLIKSGKQPQPSEQPQELPPLPIDNHETV